MLFRPAPFGRANLTSHDDHIRLVSEVHDHDHEEFLVCPD